MLVPPKAFYRTRRELSLGSSQVFYGSAFARNPGRARRRTNHRSTRLARVYRRADSATCHKHRAGHRPLLSQGFAVRRV